jgi:hypothetical protein
MWDSTLIPLRFLLSRFVTDCSAEIETARIKESSLPATALIDVRFQ